MISAGSSESNAMSRRRRPMILIVCAVLIMIGGFLVSRAWQGHVERERERLESERLERVGRYRGELQPLLERARAIMDGTADPPASEELDGELFYWGWDHRRGAYPDTTRVEVSPIEVTNVAPDGEGGLTVTVSFKVTQYRADGGVDSHASFVGDTWHARRGGSGWVVYRIETSP